MTIIVDEDMLARVARDRRFDPRTLEIARRLFLEKENVKKLSTEYGVIFQRIYAIRKMVLEAAEEYALPQGWSEVSLRGPAEVVQAVEKIF